MDENMENQDFEGKARKLGWRPLEEFKGSQDHWVDAETFLRRGEEVMPLLKATNKELERRTAAQDAKIARLETLLTASQESLEALKQTAGDQVRRQVEAARIRLLGELKQAREDGDVDAEVQVQDQLLNIRDAIIEQEARDRKQKEAPVNAAPNNQNIDPAVAEFQASNPWLGVDQRKTARFMGLAQQMRGDEQFDSLHGIDFLEAVNEALEKQTRPASSKVASSSPTGGGGSGGGKGYDSLPADAKAACQNQARKLVGEGRAFKNMKDWQTEYAKIYYSQEQ